MLRLSEVRQAVVLGAHPDDIEIGAGGLLLTLAAANPGVRVHYVLCTGTPDRHAEAMAAAAAFLPGATLTTSLHTLPDGRLPAHWAEVKRIVDDAAASRPELVLSPWTGDAHQDHRLIGELVPTAFRSALHLQYEIPKWDGDLGRPQLYVPLTDEVAAAKVAHLDTCFGSQRDRDWWTEETFRGLMRLRGIECRAPYAEAFHCAKATLRLTA
ncbi:PIG-L deacetylase family protein [Catellatospora chokoriensis]|uniref:GlcNAc-PI de-N-acetylase n=1 Tax=Catellatospora chokoriensis TaxID=310353 RepID=A0A8J3JUP9_9ACTN|nr:PIG-L family deacetylase [Catellatospora chokoriensis]GIF87217.1 GlcNAc-PI de-N-acetylase [Catellatospora chokoriensis]